MLNYTSALSLSLTLTLTHTLSHTQTRTYSLSFLYSPPLSQRHTLSLSFFSSFCLSLSFFSSLFLSLSLSLSLTHALSLSFFHSLLFLSLSSLVSYFFAKLSLLKISCAFVEYVTSAGKTIIYSFFRFSEKNKIIIWAASLDQTSCGNMQMMETKQMTMKRLKKITLKLLWHLNKRQFVLPWFQTIASICFLLRPCVSVTVSGFWVILGKCTAYRENKNRIVRYIFDTFQPPEI